MKTGVIGIGKMGISHLSILNGVMDTEVVSICDKGGLVLDAIKKFSHFKYFDDYKELYEKTNPDCVVISTPTNIHYKIVKFFLEKNVSVFVEKPLCNDYKSAYELTELARNKNIQTQVGYHNRFIATFTYIKKLLDLQILGDVYHFTAEVNGPAYLKESKTSWRSRSSEGGGCLLDYGSHLINLVNYYWDLPFEVTGTIFKKLFSKESEDAVFSNLIFPNNLSGNLTINWSEQTFRRMSILITILGKKGKIIVDSQECKIYLMEDYEKENLKKGWNFKYITDFTKPVDFFVRGEEYTYQLNYFINMVKNNYQHGNINSFENSVKTNYVIEMIRKDAVWS